MLALKLDDSWRQVDLGGGLLQNRGPTTIEVAEETTLPQVAYSLLAYNEILSADKWGGDTVYLRKSQTASGDSAIVVVPNNATNELAAIQQIFEETDNGVLFDYATTTNLYQDPAATTAAAVGAPVGAMLDVSRGLEIDPTDLALGNVSVAVGWTRAENTFATNLPDDFSSAGGVRFLDVLPGKAYRVTVSITKTNFATQPATSLQLLKRNSANTANIIVVSSTTASLSGVYITDILISNAESSNQALQFFAGGWRGSFTVTIQEIKGSHAFQATTANQPRLQQTPTTGRYWLESIDAVRSLNITTATPYGTMYIGRVTPEGMVWSTENWSTTTRNVLGGIGSYSAGYVARGREFTVAEKALIEAYFARQMPTLGPNLYQNFTFDSDTIWNKGSGWTIANGVASGTGQATTISQDIAVEANELLWGSIDVNSISGSGLHHPFFSVATSKSIVSPGVYKNTYMRNVNATYIGARMLGTDTTVEVDNLSVQRVL